MEQIAWLSGGRTLWPASYGLDRVTELPIFITDITWVIFNAARDHQIRGMSEIRVNPENRQSAEDILQASRASLWQRS